MLCADHGVAYQADMSAGRVEYDETYWAKVMAYEGSEIARTVIEGRVEMVRRHTSPGARLIDVGAGTGAFVRAAMDVGYRSRGFDVMPRAVEQLKRDGLYAANVALFDVVTMWDAIEHMEHPQHFLDWVKPGAALLVSVPIFGDIARVRESRHYRPGEHLYYFTRDGLVAWLARHEFRLLDESDHEIRAGRESIGAFAFRRKPPQH